MEAKDTVNRKDLRAIRERIRQLDPFLTADREGEIAEATAQYQAEISFKAGMQEERERIIADIKMHIISTHPDKNNPGWVKITLNYLQSYWQALVKSISADAGAERIGDCETQGSAL